jgi:hypothetical protein
MALAGDLYEAETDCGGAHNMGSSKCEATNQNLLANYYARCLLTAPNMAILSKICKLFSYSFPQAKSRPL